MDKRYGRVTWGNSQPRSRTSRAYWRQALRWDLQAEERRQRLRVFPSLCDVFDEEAPPEWRHDFFNLIACTPYLDWLLLTKRSWQMVEMLHTRWPRGLPRNIWAGVSVENQEWADRRREHLHILQAQTKFASYEPALGPVSWQGWEFLDWMIVGGESGPHARRFESSWARDTLDWCQGNGVAFFMKQKGSNSDVAGHSSKGDNPEEWPEWCRVREFPDRPRLCLT